MLPQQEIFEKFPSLLANPEVDESREDLLRDASWRLVKFALRLYITSGVLAETLCCTTRTGRGC